jgi:O-antigen/teichoic acid export membrane protein
LLSEKWTEAAPIFTLLAIATATQAVLGVAGTFLMVLGRTDIQKILSFQFSVLWIAGIVSTVHYGIQAVALCHTLCVIAFSFWSLRTILHVLGCSAVAYIGTLYIPVCVSMLDILLFKLMLTTVPLGQSNVVAVACVLAFFAVVSSFLMQKHKLRNTMYQLGATLPNRSTVTL